MRCPHLKPVNLNIMESTSEDLELEKKMPLASSTPPHPLICSFYWGRGSSRRKMTKRTKLK